MSGQGENPGFLGRWSRLKRGVETPPEPDAPPEAPPDPIPARAEGMPAPAACPIPGMAPVDLSTLPPIEELTIGSDLAPFLRPGIPSALRAAALRRMWSLDPEIRDFIGCVEYQWDFNTPGGLPAGFASELGGDLKKLLAQAIGEPQDKPEPGAEISGEEPGEAPEESREEAPPPASGLQVIASSPPIRDATPAPGSMPPDEEAMAPQPRRRHGGAMPV